MRHHVQMEDLQELESMELQQATHIPVQIVARDDVCAFCVCCVKSHHVYLWVMSTMSAIRNAGAFFLNDGVQYSYNSCT